MPAEDLCRTLLQRAQNRSLDEEIHRKMSGDLHKAINLKKVGDLGGPWIVESWTFLCNYPIAEHIAARIITLGRREGIDVSWQGPQFIAGLLLEYPGILDQFPDLQTVILSAQIGEMQENLSAISGNFLSSCRLPAYPLQPPRRSS